MCLVSHGTWRAVAFLWVFLTDVLHGFYSSEWVVSCARHTDSWMTAIDETDVLIQRYPGQYSLVKNGDWFYGNISSVSTKLVVSPSVSGWGVAATHWKDVKFSGLYRQCHAIRRPFNINKHDHGTGALSHADSPRWPPWRQFRCIKTLCAINFDPRLPLPNWKT